MDKFRAYLQLVRLPAVFTAMADILAGFLLTHRTLEPHSDLALLLVASSCLYLSGMVLNDVFDRDVDARERPGRPLPSGRVSVKSAVAISLLLILAGLTAAAFVRPRSLVLAAGLTLCIVAYDGYLKRTFLGPVAMGGCRFLNVMLGASATYFISVWVRPQLLVAGALGVYVAGVTWFSRQEARPGSRGQLASALGVVNLGLAGFVAFVATRPGAAVWPGSAVPGPSVAIVPLAVILLTINRRAVAGLLDPSPQNVQAAVKLMILSIIMLDAVIVFFHTGSGWYGLLTASLLLPAMVLGRWVFVT